MNERDILAQKDFAVKEALTVGNPMPLNIIKSRERNGQKAKLSGGVI